MESLVDKSLASKGTNLSFWSGKSVFVTGHTGFKGSWLSLWLTSLGAKVHGYSLNPPTDPSLFELLNLSQTMNSIVGDVRDQEKLTEAMIEAQPQVVFHLAAQPLVRESYRTPIETYEVNVMGTAKVLESARQIPSIKSIVVITTDKCYENGERIWGYREDEPLGGHDPYSNSKACSELVASAYRRSFDLPVATARAGNVIGGGDWAKDRLIPDCIRAILSGEPVILRSPGSVRPWQHVIEPLSGYLDLARLIFENGSSFCESWNFGPRDDDERTVKEVVDLLCRLWGDGASYKCTDKCTEEANPLHEASMLRLDCSKSRFRLNWTPKWDLEQALQATVEWTKAWASGSSSEDLRSLMLGQIGDYRG